MEKVTFTNANSDTIIFTTDDPSVTYPYKMVAKTGFESADIQAQTSTAYGISGTIYRDTTLGVRYLKIDFIFTEPNVSDLADTRRDIIQKLNPMLGEGQIEYIGENGDAYYINATVSNGPVVTAEMPLATRMQVVFLCTQPFWEGEEQTEVKTFQSITTTTMTNTGDVPRPFKVVYEVTTGTATGCKIFSTQVIEILNQPMIPGDLLTIDTDIRNITVSFYDVTLDTTTNAFNRISADSEFFDAVSNLGLARNGASDGSYVKATITWRDRFVGV